MAYIILLTIDFILLGYPVLFKNAIHEPIRKIFPWNIFCREEVWNHVELAAKALNENKTEYKANHVLYVLDEKQIFILNALFKRSLSKSFLFLLGLAIFEKLLKIRGNKPMALCCMPIYFYLIYGILEPLMRERFYYRAIRLIKVK